MRTHTCRQSVYIRPIVLCAVSQLHFLVKSINTYFIPLFYSIMLDRLTFVVYYSQFCQTESTIIDNRSLFLVESVRQTLFASLFYSSLHPCFAHEFQSSICRETRFTSLYISLVLFFQRQRQTCLVCLFFTSYVLAQQFYCSPVYNQTQTGRQTETQ